MAIRIKFFASLRERFGSAEMELPSAGVVTVADVWSRVAPDEPLGSSVLMSVNMDYARPDHPVQDGDEVGFFPPVTGGGR